MVTGSCSDAASKRIHYINFTKIYSTAQDRWVINMWGTNAHWTHELFPVGSVSLHNISWWECTQKAGSSPTFGWSMAFMVQTVSRKQESGRWWLGLFLLFRHEQSRGLSPGKHRGRHASAPRTISASRYWLLLCKLLSNLSEASTREHCTFWSAGQSQALTQTAKSVAAIKTRVSPRVSAHSVHLLGL